MLSAIFTKCLKIGLYAVIMASVEALFTQAMDKLAIRTEPGLSLQLMKWKC
jgi:hypothetical protein